MSRVFKLQMVALGLAVWISLIFYTADAQAQLVIPSVGKGSIEVILFSDYFCPPCKRIDRQAESLLKELLSTGGVKITFVDVPFRKETVFFNKYYLYAANAVPDAENILRVRRKLFEAAQERRIRTEEALQTYLKKENILLKPFDERTIRPLMIALNQEYKVDQTPICVIYYSASKTKRLVGTDEIWTGLTMLQSELTKAKKRKP